MTHRSFPLPDFDEPILDGIDPSDKILRVLHIYTSIHQYPSRTSGFKD